MVTPMMETTWSKVTPVVATVRSQVEEKVMPVIPSKVTETVQTVHNVAVSNISAAVEKGTTVGCVVALIIWSADEDVEDEDDLEEEEGE